jgi:hypothetical protein
MKTEMTMTYTFDDQIVSDLHKDAYGYRPSQGWWQAWNGMADSEKQAEWDRLIVAFEEEQEYEVRREERNFEAWTGRFLSLCVDLGVSHKDAIRWDMDAEGADDVEHYCYLQGIGFHRAEAIRELLKEGK